jgi:lysophospholipase L1-like esterase
VPGYVFYDENRNNVADPDETIRFGDVDVEVSGRSGVSAQSTGQFDVQGVPAGTYPIGIRTPSLPAFFVAGASPTVQVPGTARTPVPVALPIGSNSPWVYLSEGDSISQGQGSSDGRGYRTILEARLEAYYGRSVGTFYRGNGGGTTEDGANRIARDLSLLTPAYTLLLWGTNDWNTCGDPRSCFTVPNLRTMVREVKRSGGLPMVATILPANVGFNGNAPASRNVWVADANALIRTMAQEEGAAVVDLYAVFMRQASLAPLFVDHVHPNPAGHQLIAQTFFEAITRPRSLAASDSLF